MSAPTDAPQPADEPVEVTLRLPAGHAAAMQRLATIAGVPVEHVIQVLLAVQFRTQPDSDGDAA